MKPIPFVTAGLMASALAHAAIAAEETFDVDGFSGIDVSAGIEVNITTSDTYSISAQAKRPRDLNRLLIRRDGNMLEIGRKPGWSILSFFGSNDHVVVTVTMPELAEIDASSGSTVSFSGDVTDALIVDVSSGATATLSGISGDFVDLSSSSGSSLRVDGTCDRVAADASSGSTISAADLVCASADAEASSGSTVSVHANESANGDASSGASIRVSGNPQTTTEDSSSGGSVTFR